WPSSLMASSGSATSISFLFTSSLLRVDAKRRITQRVRRGVEEVQTGTRQALLVVSLPFLDLLGRPWQERNRDGKVAVERLGDMDIAIPQGMAEDDDRLLARHQLLIAEGEVRGGLDHRALVFGIAFRHEQGDRTEWILVAHEPLEGIQKVLAFSGDVLGRAAVEQGIKVEPAVEIEDAGHVLRCLRIRRVE